MIRWRGEADPRAVKALDTYWISAAEHGLNASTFTARIAASTGADCAAAMSAAVGTLSGPLHGGAPARVLPMLDAVEESGDPEEYVSDLLDRGERIMGFGHRVYRAEDPRARVLKRTAQELGSPQVEVAAALEQVALAALREKSPDRPLETNVEYWAAVVLDIAEIPADLTPAMFGCARVAGWSAHILEQKRTGRLIRPSASYIGPPPRSIADVRRVTLAEAAAQADALAEEGNERELSQLRARVGRGARVGGAVAPTSATARSRFGRSGSFVSARRRSCCAAGWTTRARPCAARRCSRSNGCRVIIPVTSTTCARCCTSS